MNLDFARIACILFLSVAVSPWARSVPVVINEFQASNGETIADEDGDFEDWIELYNHGVEPVLLGGYGLSDNEDNPFKWELPDIALGPGEFLLVFASGKDRRQGPFLHSNFAVSSSGEELLLTAPDGTQLDFVPPTAVPTDHSFGRQPDGTGAWFFFDAPTPGTSNTTTPYLGILKPPEFSHEGGFYEEPFQLVLTTSHPGATIVYTLDGATPEPGGAVYNGPIPIENRDADPNTLSLLSTDYAPWHRQPMPEWEGPLGQVRKAVTVRAAVRVDGMTSSETVTRTYFVGDDFYQRNAIPVVSLVTDHEHLFDSERGIYVRGKIFDDFHPEWEAASPTAFFHAHPGNFHQRGRTHLDLSGIPAVEFTGGRMAIPLPGHGLTLDFSFVYEVPQVTLSGTTHYDGVHYLVPESDADTLVFDLPYAPGAFPQGALLSQDWERPVHVEIFDAHGNLEVAQQLGVRTHGGASRASRQKTLRFYARDSYGAAFIEHNIIPGTPTARYKRFLLRRSGEGAGLHDLLAHHIVRGINPAIHTQHFRHAVVFINGEYWGWHTFRDRYDDWHLALTHGIKPNEVAMVAGTTGSLESGAPADLDHFRAMVAHIRDADLTVPANLDTVHAYMDVPNYLDYIAGGIFLNYEDWGAKHLLAWRYTGETAEQPAPLDGCWRWMVFDMDGAFGRNGGPAPNTLRTVLQSSDYLLAELMVADPFRHAFINRLADLMNNILREDRAPDWLAEIRIGLTDEVVLENILRWRNTGDSFEAWAELAGSVQDFLERRPAFVRGHIVNEFKLEGTYTLRIAIPDGGVSGIRVNSIELDVSESEWTGIYFLGVPIEVEITPEFGHEFIGWEGQFEGEGTLLALDPRADISLVPIVKDDGVTLHEVILPRFMQGTTPDNNDRVPYACRLRIEGLLPNALYRFASRVVSADDPYTQNGAGNAIYYDFTTGSHFRTTATPDFAVSGTYGEFVTDDHGNYEGWFTLEPSGNPRFGEPELFVRILLNDGLGGEVYRHFLTTQNTVQVLPFGFGWDEATGIYASSPLTPGDVVVLHDDIDGAGRPLTATLIEDAGFEVDDRYTTFYEQFVSGFDGHFGALLPNLLPDGLRRIESFGRFDAESTAVYTSADGFWPDNADTVNPDGGLAFTFALTLGPPDSDLPGDVNGDGVVNAVDVQLVINAALGVPIDPAFNADINGDGLINAVDVQWVINAALGAAG